MKIAGSFLIWFFLLLFSVNFLMGGYFYLDSRLRAKKSIVSPLPNLLVTTFYKSAEASSYWGPNLSENYVIKNKPLLSAKSIISYDLTSNRLLYGENIDQPMPIASITKIMTAILILENMDLTKEVKISKKAASIGENSMILETGEVHTVENLLYGLLLPSGNDAAQALAESSPFGIENFVHLMNKKAEDLGLTSTRFTNPSGLEGDGRQYSTAKEILILTRYALQNPTFAKIISTYEHAIPANGNHKEYVLYNETNLLTSYPGVKGVKTGYTDEAGMCLVSYLEHNGHKIIAVLLNSANRRSEMKTLLDYSLKSLGETPPPHN